MEKIEILEDGSMKGKTFSGEKFKGNYPHPKQNETYGEYKQRVDNLKKEGFHLGDLSWRDYDIYCIGYGYQEVSKDDLIFVN